MSIHGSIVLFLASKLISGEPVKCCFGTLKMNLWIVLILELTKKCFLNANNKINNSSSVSDDAFNFLFEYLQKWNIK